MNEPSDSVIIERSISYASEAMRTIDLQINRLQREEPEDKRFPMRWWVDIHFLIITFRRLMRVADLATKIRNIEKKQGVKKAKKAFVKTLPNLTKMRNVYEHFDEYNVSSSKCRHIKIDRKGLQTGSWDGTTFIWRIGEENRIELNVTIAKKEAYNLYSAIRKLKSDEIS